MHPHSDDFYHGGGRRFLKRLSHALMHHHAMSRHEHGGRGHRGRRGSFPDDADGSGGDGVFSRSRKFSSDDLQLLILALLAEKPSHGYELSKALEERSKGFYKPSPGMIYPALTYLEEIGYATVTVVSNKKSYALSDEGRSFLDAHRERVEFMLAKLTEIGSKMDAMRSAFRGRSGDETTSGADWLPEYAEARHLLKHLLWSRLAGGAEEQRRIAAILRRAVDEIRSGAPGQPSGKSSAKTSGKSSGEEGEGSGPFDPAHAL
jgi:DNA-binding PadR family transcriptional regulator